MTTGRNPSMPSDEEVIGHVLHGQHDPRVERIVDSLIGTSEGTPSCLSCGGPAAADHACDECRPMMMVDAIDDTMPLAEQEAWRSALTWRHQHDRLHELLLAARDRIRHDHAYPMDVGEHHCAGCDLEQEIDAATTEPEDR